MTPDARTPAVVALVNLLLAALDAAGGPLPDVTDHAAGARRPFEAVAAEALRALGFAARWEPARRRGRRVRVLRVEFTSAAQQEAFARAVVADRRKKASVR